MKRSLPLLIGFALGGLAAWLIGPHAHISIWFVAGMFPGILIALILLFSPRARVVLPSKFSTPLQEFDSAPEPHTPRQGTPGSRKR